MLSTIWVLGIDSALTSTMANSPSLRKKSHNKKRKNWRKRSWKSKKSKSRNKRSQNCSSKRWLWKKMLQRFFKDLLSLTSQVEVSFELCLSLSFEISTSIKASINELANNTSYIWLIPYLKQHSITILSLSISFLNTYPYFYNPILLCHHQVPS
jgi:hypothetical protein